MQRARRLLGLLLGCGLVLAPMAHAEQLLEWSNGGEFISFRANEPITIDLGMIQFSSASDCLGGGIPDTFFPVADIYILKSGPLPVGSTLTDVSGAPNTVEAATGGVFVSETIGFTVPSGRIEAGSYAVVYDECQDGKFDANDFYLDRAFTVLGVPVDVPPLPNNIAALKTRAAEHAQKWAEARNYWQVLFAIQDAFDLITMRDIMDLVMWAARQYQLPAVRGPVITALHNTVKHYAAIAEDPPDPDFRRLAFLGSRELLDAQSIDPLLIAAANLGSVVSNEAALLSAFLTALERYQGAEAANNGDWALAHARTLHTYAELLKEQLVRTNSALVAVQAVLSADTRPLDETASHWQALQSRVEATGFTEDERRVMQDLALSDEEIADVQAILLAQTFGPFSKTEFLATLSSIQTTNMELRADLTTFSTAITGVSATMTSTPFVLDRVPIANVGGPYVGDEGTPIMFNGTSSSGPGGISSYQWDFDGKGREGFSGTVDLGTVGFSLGSQEVVIAVNDFNVDGNLDLVAVNETPNMSVFLGRGNGTFGSADMLAVDSIISPLAIASGDVNMDGVPDLLLGDMFAAPGSINLRLGDGTGGFSNPVTVTDIGSIKNSLDPIFSLRRPYGILLRDFNHDNFLDIAAAGDTSVIIQLGDGTGSFSAPALVWVERDHWSGWNASFIAEDFNADGNLDLALPCDCWHHRWYSFVVLFGDGTGAFPTALKVVHDPGNAPSVHNMHVGDFNEDGHLDVVGTDGVGFIDPPIHIFFGDSTGNFVVGTPIPLTFRPHGLAVFDVNGDGHLDLLVPRFEETAVFLGDGTGGFSRSMSLAFSGVPWTMIGGDFNTDGSPDLTWGNAGHSIVAVAIAGGTFNDATGPTPTFTFPQASTGIVGLLVNTPEGFANVDYGFVQVANVNSPPAIEAFAPNPLSVIMPVGGSQLFDITAIDPDGDTVHSTWQLDGNPVAATPSFTFTPTEADIGIHLLTVTVTDHHPLGGTVHLTWSIAVTRENPDSDGDDVTDDDDNCREVPNADQADVDRDGTGNACDICPMDALDDEDDDGICGEVDNCPVMANADQTDADGDDVGDACDPDDDNDGMADNDDNCPLVANTNQADFDRDGAGDVCDLDSDEDAVTDAADYCLNTPLGATVNADGCAIAQLCPCENHWKNHGAYVSCVAQTSEDFIAAGFLIEVQKEAMVSAAAAASCGKKK